MKKKPGKTLFLTTCLFISVTVYTQAPIGITKIRVINMVPNAQSNEINQDSEPNIAVNPFNVNQMAGSAFTFNATGAVNRAPIYISTDVGNTWALNNIVPSGNGGTGDISLKFGTRGNELYTGILLGGSALTMNILRTNNPFGTAAMQLLVTRNGGGGVDQPYVNVLTSIVAGIERDRVFVGNNDLNNTPGNGGTGRTATVDHSADARTAPAPAGFTNNVIEARATNGQDRPSVRSAAHTNGTVYGLFARTTASNGVNRTCDITVVRDNNFATGTTPFTALTGAGGLAGVLVATGVNMPFINAAGGLGQNRLGSHLSIAVHPGNSNTVYISWTDRTGTTGTVLHVRRSTDAGVNWSADLLTVTNGLNPALAVNSSGVVGCLYQQLVTTAGVNRWETHVRRSSNGTTWSDIVLSNTPDNNPVPAFQPYLGDYCDMMAVGANFYGVFSASNIPDSANFPQGVKYQRNADFNTGQLRNLANTGNVAVSIDPYFFAIEQKRFFDRCLIAPSLCRPVELSPFTINIECPTVPCVRIDPIPRNCLVKFDCPGCGGGNVLCPPYYHMFFDGIDPVQWSVTLINKLGDPVRSEFNRTRSGIVISFRPDKNGYIEKQIGDYYLVFESKQLRGQKKFTIKTRLEVSDYRYTEHIVMGKKD